MSYQIINGEFLQEEESHIPLTDLGLLRGYAVFDYLRILEGVPVFVEEHLDRLYYSTKLMYLDLSWSRDEIRQMIDELITLNNTVIGGLKIIVTGGYSADGYSPTTPNLFITISPLTMPKEEDYRNGRAIITSAYQRDLPLSKTTIYVHSINLLNVMRQKSAVEVLYHHDGAITECSRSNIFLVTDDGRIHTPKDNLLSGITRKQVLEHCCQGIPVELRDVHLAEVSRYRECFITSSTKTILPIVRIDETELASGVPGPVTRVVFERFNAHVTKYLESRRP